MHASLQRLGLRVALPVDPTSNLTAIQTLTIALHWSLFLSKSRRRSNILLHLVILITLLDVINSRNVPQSSRIIFDVKLLNLDQACLGISSRRTPRGFIAWDGGWSCGYTLHDGTRGEWVVDDWTVWDVTAWQDHCALCQDAVLMIGHRLDVLDDFDLDNTACISLSDLWSLLGEEWSIISISFVFREGLWRFQLSWSR